MLLLPPQRVLGLLAATTREFSICARVWSSCDRAVARLASRFCTAVSRLRGSISSSSWPFFTTLALDDRQR